MEKKISGKKHGPAPGILRAGPLFPERVMRIFHLRRSGRTLQNIADELNITTAGVCHILKRWGGWAEMNYSYNELVDKAPDIKVEAERRFTTPALMGRANSSILKELYLALSELNAKGYFDEKKNEEPKQAKESSMLLVHKNERRKGYEKAAQEKGVKLTKQDAMDIFKEDRMSYAEIAEIFGVTESTIYQIKHGYTWWKITGMPKHPNCRNNVKNRAS